MLVNINDKNGHTYFTQKQNTKFRIIMEEVEKLYNSLSDF